MQHEQRVSHCVWRPNHNQRVRGNESDRAIMHTPMLCYVGNTTWLNRPCSSDRAYAHQTELVTNTCSPIWIPPFILCLYIFVTEFTLYKLFCHTIWQLLITMTVGPTCPNIAGDMDANLKPPCPHDQISFSAARGPSQIIWTHVFGVLVEQDVLVGFYKAANNEKSKQISGFM